MPEFYTSIAETPFRVDARCDAKEGRMEITDFGKPDDKEQNLILEFAVNDFTLLSATIRQYPSPAFC